MRIILRVIDTNINDNDDNNRHRSTINNKITHVNDYVNTDTHKSQLLYSQSSSIHRKASLINLLVTHTIRPLISSKSISKKKTHRPLSTASSLITTKDVILIRPEIDNYNNDYDNDGYYNVIVRLNDNDDETSKLKIGDTYSASFYRQQSNAFYLKSTNSLIIYCFILNLFIVKFKIS
jgi:hypothetical protein